MTVAMQTMFYKLTNYEMERTWLQAIGFYITYLIVIQIAAVLIYFLLISITRQSIDPATSLNLGKAVAMIISMALGTLIITEKQSLSNYPLVALIGLAGILAMVGGALLGLLPIAYLTTQPSKSFGGHPELTDPKKTTSDTESPIIEKSNSDMPQK